MSEVSSTTLGELIWRGDHTPTADNSSTHERRLSSNGMKDSMMRFFDESNIQNFSIFNDICAPDFVSYGGAGFGDVHGPDAFKDLYLQYISSMPDMFVQVDDMIADGNLCGVRATLTGTHKGDFMGFAPPTGKRITWTGTAVHRFNDDGLMDARWQEFNGLSVMQQMGVIPSPDEGSKSPPEPTPPHVVGGKFTTPSQNKAMVRRFIEEFWNQGEMSVADEIFHPHATSPSAPQLPPGPDGVRTIAAMFRSAMPDYHMEVLDLLAEGDRVMVRLVQSGTQKGELMGVPPSGKNATWGEIGILRFAGGQIVESWYDVDLLGMFQQLGVSGSINAGA